MIIGNIIFELETVGGIGNRSNKLLLHFDCDNKASCGTNPNLPGKHMRSKKVRVSIQ